MPSLASLGPQTTFHALPEELTGCGHAIEAIYVHVPFCSTKCHYCDFYSLAGHLDRAEAFLDALEIELTLQVRHFGKQRPKTIFVGGGTPTLLSAQLLQRLLTLLHEQFDLSAAEEFTVEANPNTFDATKAAVLVSGGVNRISFGAQSFHAAELQMLQRDHDPASVAAAFAAARAAGLRNLNVDLIFGIPGQTASSWDESLTRALELAPDHMSCYSLIYEPNTAMTARLRQGDFQKLDEETELAMFELTYRRLSAAGFTRYEISNYARSRRCEHNLIYWRAGNWLGLGPSAGSHIAPAPTSDEGSSNAPAAWQWKNAGSLAQYLGALHPAAARLPVTQMEPLARRKWAAGAAVFWLRLNEGLCFEQFTARTGVMVRPALEKVLRPYVEQGFAEVTPQRARITQRGVAVSDYILKRVLAALEHGP